MESIPKSFWHAVSVAILLVTVGLMYVFYHAGEIAIKYKNIEISANKLDSQASRLKGKYEALIEKEINYVKEIRRLEELLTNSTETGGACNDEQESDDRETLSRTFIELRDSANNELLQLQQQRNNIETIQNNLQVVTTHQVEEARSSIIFDRSGAKAGYFLPLGGDLRLKVDEVSGVKAKIRINNNGGTLLEKEITVNDEFQFTVDDSVYTVTFLKTGHMGLNFIKKAAFFKVVRQ